MVSPGGVILPNKVNRPAGPLSTLGDGREYRNKTSSDGDCKATCLAYQTAIGFRQCLFMEVDERKFLLDLVRDPLPALPGLSNPLKNMLCTKAEVDNLYELPREVRFCNLCVISNQRPRIVFDAAGICNACLYWQRKKRVDWRARSEEFGALLDQFRSKDGSFDVLVPSSGGKDSVRVALSLRDDYGMHPLTFTWAPFVYTDIGFRNLYWHIQHGFDNVLLHPKGNIHRMMARESLIKIGDPFQPFVYGQTYSPLKVAAQYGIGLVVDGENGDAEYGGNPEAESLKGYGEEDAAKFWLSGLELDAWLEAGFSHRDLEMYFPKPPTNAPPPVQRVFFSYFHDWRPQENFYIASSKGGFKPNSVRSEGTYSKYASLDDQTDPYHYYLGMLKFGLGRATSDAAHEIREGLISREEGVNLVRKYDTNTPSGTHYKTLANYMSMSSEELEMLEQRWRNPRLWEADGTGHKLVSQIK